MSKYEKLVDVTSKGFACLCFPNVARLSVAEINAIFSEYGEIMKINCAGDESGFRFVRFRTKEQALDCAIALDGNSKIKLQPVRSKLKDLTENNHPDKFSKNKQENVNKQQDDRTHYNAEQTEKADSIKGSQSSRKSRSNKKNTKNQVQNEFSGINSLNNTNCETSNEDFNAQRYATTDQNPMRKHCNVRSAKNFPESDESADKKVEMQNPNNRMNAAKFAQLYKLRGTIANTFQPSGIDLATGVHALPAALKPLTMISSPPPSYYSSEGRSAMTDMPPPLVSSIPASQFGRANIPENEIEVLLACDVIVANIHSNIGVSNIYQMFGKFSPIYVSDIETVSEINVRFCYVYFETPNDALEVEQSFDGVSVHGQNLITLRSHRLEVEAGIF